MIDHNALFTLFHTNFKILWQCYSDNIKTKYNIVIIDKKNTQLISSFVGYKHFPVPEHKKNQLNK